MRNHLAVNKTHWRNVNGCLCFYLFIYLIFESDILLGGFVLVLLKYILSVN